MIEVTQSLSHSLASLTQQSRPGAVDIETSVKTKGWRLMMAWGRGLLSLLSNLSLHTMTVKAQSLPITSTKPGHREMWVKSRVLLLPPSFFPSVCLLVPKIPPWAQNFLLAMNVSSGCQWPRGVGVESGGRVVGDDKHLWDQLHLESIWYILI